jgi:hypothetical protein
MSLTGVPDSYEACERYAADYERQHVRRNKATSGLVEPMFNLARTYVPRALAPAVRPVVATLVERELLDVYGIPDPPAWLRNFSLGVLRLRARALRWAPPRLRPASFVDGPARSYPRGYRIADLGPPDDWRRPRNVTPRA